MSSRKLGHRNYPVDKRGANFECKTRDVYVKVLMCPHSARLYKKRVWADNSGYGEFVCIENGSFEVIQKLPGWTRGLCIVEDIAFVGVSRVLPRFSMYPPGLKVEEKNCGVYAICLKSGHILGSIHWPFGYQTFFHNLKETMELCFTHG